MTVFRKGDVVRVSAVVESDFATDDDEVWIKIEDRTLFVKPDHIDMVRPVFQAGDRVEHDGDEAKIIAIHGKYAWIDPGYVPQIVFLSELKRVAKTPEMESEDA